MRPSFLDPEMDSGASVRSPRTARVKTRRPGCCGRFSAGRRRCGVDGAFTPCPRLVLAAAHGIAGGFPVQRPPPRAAQLCVRSRPAEGAQEASRASGLRVSWRRARGGGGPGGREVARPVLGGAGAAPRTEAGSQRCRWARRLAPKPFLRQSASRSLVASGGPRRGDTQAASPRGGLVASPCGTRGRGFWKRHAPGDPGHARPAPLLRREPNAMWGSRPHAGPGVPGLRRVCRRPPAAVTGQGC